MEERIREIVNIECIACDGSGAYPTGINDDWEQCQYCHQIRFPFIENATKAILTAVAESETKARIDELNRLKTGAFGNLSAGYVVERLAQLGKEE